MVPIVIDSVDETLSLILGENDIGTPRRARKYGKEYIFHMDQTVGQVLRDLEEDINFLSSAYLIDKRIRLGMDDGGIVNDYSLTMGHMYKNYKNPEDNILYILVTKEHTMYGYVKSILRYLGILSKIPVV